MKWKRKIIQIAATPPAMVGMDFDETGEGYTVPPCLFALTNDGEVLMMKLQGDDWHWEVIMDSCPQEPLGHETDEEWKERWGNEDT